MVHISLPVSTHQATTIHEEREKPEKLIYMKSWHTVGPELREGAFNGALGQTCHYKNYLGRKVRRQQYS